MSHNSTPTAILCLLAAAILLVPTVQSATPTVNPSHETSLRNDQGAAAPYGPWERVPETVTLYLHRDQKIGNLTQTPSAPDDALTTASPDSTYYMDYERPSDPVPALVVDPDPEDGTIYLFDENHENDRKVIIASTGFDPGEIPEEIEDGVPVPVVGGTEPTKPLNAVGHWTLPTSLTPTQDFRIYNFEAEIYATCIPSEPSLDSPGDQTLLLYFERLDLQADGSWVRHDFDSGSSYAPLKSLSLVASSIPGESTGVVEFSNLLGPSDVYLGDDLNSGNPFAENGLLIEHGKHRLQLSLWSPIAGACIVHFDSQTFPSNIKLQTDTGRVSSWIETTAGQPIEGLPKPATSSAEKRNFLVQIAQVSAWPQYNHYENARAGGPAARNYLDDIWDTSDPTPARLRDLSPIPVYNDPAKDDGTSGAAVNSAAHRAAINSQAVSASKIDLRIRNLDTGLIASGTSSDKINLVPGTRQIFDVGESINRVQYTYFYPGSLPEVNYQLEVVGENWGIARSLPFIAGLKGFTLQTIGSATHDVNAGEATEFLMRLRNVGADGDTAQLSVSPPGDNWAAEVVGGSQFLNGNGGEFTVVVRVTPPSTALAGVNKTIHVTASSSLFAAEVPPVSQDVQVRIVAARTPGIDVTSPITIIEVEPGQQVSLAGIRATNTGTFGETYLLSARVPTSNNDWTATVTPPSKFIAAASPTDFPVVVKAPPTARDGTAVPVTISATSLSDGAVTDSAVITVVVRSLAGMVLSTSQMPALRTVDHCQEFVQSATQACTSAGAAALPGTIANPTGGLAGPTDPDADLTQLIRIAITNPSLVADTYTVQGFADPSNPGGSRVTSSGDWGGRFGNATAPTGSLPSGHNVNTRITVPGQTTQYFYFEAGYNNNWPCSNRARSPLTSCPGSDPDTSNLFRLAFRSINDPGVQKIIDLTFARTTAVTSQVTITSTHATSVHNVTVEPDILDLDPADKVSPGATGQHLFRVINRANEKDTIIVAMTGTPTPGFTRTLQFVGAVPSVNTCNADVSGTKFTCPMGSGDQAVFRLNSTPSASTPVGAVDAAGIAAISGDNGARLDAMAFETIVVGTFQFAAQELDAARDVERGRAGNLPFVIRNQGSADDTYTVSMLSGDGTWQPRFSTGATQFVPAGRDVSGFLVLSVPSDATVGSTQLFRVQVTSNGSGQAEVMDFTATVRAPSTMTVTGIPSNELLLPTRGIVTQVTVRVTDTGLTGAGRDVTVAVDPASLPPGWSVSSSGTQCPSRPDAMSCAVNLTLLAPSAEVVFNVTAPTTALSTTRANLHFTATSPSPTVLTGFGDVFLSLADVFGLDLQLLSANQTIVPGGEVVHLVRVNNTGLSQTTVSLTNTPVPAGWFIQYNPANLTLGPLESRVIEVLVRAPLGATAATMVPVTILASSGTPPATDQLTLTTTVGFFKLELDNRVIAPAANLTGNATNGTANGTANATANATASTSNVQPVPRIAPGESATYVVRIFNNGTLPDEVRPVYTVSSSNGVGLVVATTVPETALLLPGEGVDFTVNLALAEGVPSDQDIVMNATFRSLRDPMPEPTQVSQDLTIHVLRHARLDADFDGNAEFAIDRNEDPADGFEQFIESANSGGRTSRVANLERFLADSARAKFNVTMALPDNTTMTVFSYGIDGDKDGRVDYFLDHNGDDLPDFYWDPDAGRSQELKTLKDVNGDQVPEYFLDLAGSGYFTDVFDLRQGNFTPLLRRDIDGDGKADYVVDADSDGVVDDSETVLYSVNGRLNSVLKRDVDGDGRLDEVHDVDGDDAPDFFLRAGSEVPIEIVMEDVNGDGVLDWTYDSDGDGRRDSYYDPATGSVGLIDGPQRFMDQLRQYWWVGGAFALVLLLFVALLIVTRR